jgi:hypothetical protein
LLHPTSRSILNGLTRRGDDSEFGAFATRIIADLPEISGEANLVEVLLKVIDPRHSVICREAIEATDQSCLVQRDELAARVMGILFSPAFDMFFRPEEIEAVSSHFPVVKPLPKRKPDMDAQLRVTLFNDSPIFATNLEGLTAVRTAGSDQRLIVREHVGQPQCVESAYCVGGVPAVVSHMMDGRDVRERKRHQQVLRTGNSDDVVLPLQLVQDLDHSLTADAKVSHQVA